MTTETKLLPCPFCGEEPELKKDHRWPDGCGNYPVDAYEVVCMNWGCLIYRADNKWFKTEAEAIEAWNRRATDGLRVS